MQKTPVDSNQPRTPPCVDVPEGYGTPGGDGGWHHPSPEPPRVPCKFPPSHCHCLSSSRCPANPFQTDERTSWKPKVGRRRRCDPPRPHPAPTLVPRRHVAPLPRVHLGTKGCFWGWARGGCLFLALVGGSRGWMGPLAPPERVTEPPPPCAACTPKPPALPLGCPALSPGE